MGSPHHTKNLQTVGGSSSSTKTLHMRTKVNGHAMLGLGEGQTRPHLYALTATHTHSRACPQLFLSLGWGETQRERCVDSDHPDRGCCSQRAQMQPALDFRYDCRGSVANSMRFRPGRNLPLEFSSGRPGCSPPLDTIMWPVRELHLYIILLLFEVGKRRF